jgi:hypothetical protein
MVTITTAIAGTATTIVIAARFFKRRLAFEGYAVLTQFEAT